MTEKRPDFRLIATGIGSVPFLDMEDTCVRILESFPNAPFWPQFVNRSYLEDMSVQYCEGLPLLDTNEAERSLRLSSTRNSETELTRFYEHFLAGDTDYFAISRERAPGLYIMLDMLERKKSPVNGFVKGHSVGPVTFAAGILDTNRKPLLHNAELLEAMVNGLSIKALWQIRTLEKTGRKPILFLDEPCLSGFGSAFSAVQRHEVIHILQTMIGYLRDNSDALIGIHCCGNTDWPMIVEAGPDIINFDAFEFMTHFLLYPKEVMGFINGGGSIAWGIVPTAGFTGTETVDVLYEKLEEGLRRMHGWGIHMERLFEASLLTPACGMGSMIPEAANKCMDTLFQLSNECGTMTAR